MVHLLPQSSPFFAVATCGLLSVIACAALLLHLGVALLHRAQRMQMSSTRERVARFASTQSGILLFNLLVADLVQAIGFAISYEWAINGDWFPYHGAPLVCKVQAVFIQFADVAQAGFTIYIGIYTAATVVWGFRFGTKAFYSLVAFFWLFPFFLTVLGPPLQDFDTPFYCGSNEAYCWISPNHKQYRLPLHFIWILLASLINIPLYGTIFYHVRYRFRAEETTTASSSFSRSASGSKPGATSHISTSSTPSQLAQRIDNVALRMLCFPLAYLMTTIFITIYRLADMNGSTWSWQALTVGSCLYSLTGLVDVILYTWTRNLVSVAAPTAQLSGTRKHADGLYVPKLSQISTTKTDEFDSKDDLELQQEVSVRVYHRTAV